MATVDVPEGLEELFEQTWFDHFLHYGLMVGAIFQLICIAAIIVIPLKPEEESEYDANISDSAPRTANPEGTDSPRSTTVGGTSGTGGPNRKSGGKKARKRK